MLTSCMAVHAMQCLNVHMMSHTHTYTHTTNVLDTLIARGVAVKQVRRQLQVVSMLGPAACLVVAASPLCAASPVAASACVTVGLGLSALSLGTPRGAQNL